MRTALHAGSLGRAIVMGSILAVAALFVWDESADAAEETTAKKAVVAETQRLACTGTIVDASGSASRWNLGLSIGRPDADSLQKLSPAETAKRIRVRFFSPYPIKLLETTVGAGAPEHVSINGYTAKDRFTIRVPVDVLGKSGKVDGIAGAWTSTSGTENASFTCTSTLEAK